jgi:hypothetical protein
MLYATVTQRLSDFFPRNLPKEEQIYRDYTLPQQFWPYYTDPAYGSIRYNTYLGDVVPVNTFDVTTKGGYFNYINSLDSVYGNDGTYRYNLIAGYNRITSVNGNSNIYLGSNTNSNSINTNNTISIGHDITPENNTIILRANRDDGQIKIIPPRGISEICILNILGNNVTTYSSSTQNISSCNINLSGSYFNVFNTSENISSCNINLSGSYFNVFNTKQNISSCNINLSGSYFNVFNTKQNISSCNINLSGSYFNVFNTSENISSCNINKSNSNVFLRNSNFNVDTSKITLSSMTIAIGNSAISDRDGMFSVMHNGFSVAGDSQKSDFLLRGQTTSNSFFELFTNGSSRRMTIPSGKFWSGTVNILGIRDSGQNCARYMRQVTIGNVSGNTSIFGSVVSIGTDVNASKVISLTTYTTEIQITADNTNNSLKIEVRGLPSETMRWIASVEGVELAY